MKRTDNNMLFSAAALRKLIIPLIFEQTLAITVGMADTVMVSSVGEAAVSGVSLVDMINNLIFSVLSALATGGAVVTSQSLGGLPFGKAAFVHRNRDLACDYGTLHCPAPSHAAAVFRKD